MTTMYSQNDYRYYAELYHHGILGMKWGIRRYQNSDGSLTEEGRKRYGYGSGEAKERSVSPERYKIDKMTSDLDAYYKETKDFVKNKADAIRNDPDFKKTVLRDAEENFKINNVKSDREKKDLIQAIADDEMDLRLRNNEYFDRTQKIRDDIIDQNDVAEKAYDKGLITSKEYNDYIWKTMPAYSDAYDGFPKETKVDTSDWLPIDERSREHQKNAINKMYDRANELTDRKIEKLDAKGKTAKANVWRYAKEQNEIARAEKLSNLDKMTTKKELKDSQKQDLLDFFLGGQDHMKANSANMTTFVSRLNEYDMQRGMRMLSDQTFEKTLARMTPQEGYDYLRRKEVASRNSNNY